MATNLDQLHLIPAKQDEVDSVSLLLAQTWDRHQD
jgi:hypothetical protein